MKTLASFSALLLGSTLQATSLSQTLQENSLVVYNANMGLVHEKRSLSLDKGKQAVLYPNVASTVVTDSVNVSLPEGVNLFSQKYKYDKITLKKLLQAHIDKEVEVRVWKSKDEFVIEKGILLSSDSRVLIRLDNQKVIQSSSSDIVFDSIPSTLITQPSLLWDVYAKNKVEGSLELDYIINNISWKSDYVFKIDKNRADLSGWISLQNNSGKAFNNVSLKVLAGDVARERKKVHPRHHLPMMAAMAEADTQVKEVSHEGYHIYTIPFKVDLANNEKTQIEFIKEKDIKIQRRYDVYLSSPAYISGEYKHKVNQYVEFKGLSKALPKGTIRTYSSLEGGTVLLGVNQIEHTPKKEKVSLAIGKNFDLLVKETNLQKNGSKKYYESEVKYTVVNRSDESRKLELLVPFVKRSSLESIVQTKVKYEYKDGNILKFLVYVKADSEYDFVVKYRNKR